jgi:hypothetical protein
MQSLAGCGKRGDKQPFRPASQPVTWRRRCLSPIFLQPLERANERAADLYWVIFLLTGKCDHSLDVGIEAVDIHEGGNNFFLNWMLAWSRRLVIAKALGAIRDELARSARRTALKRTDKPPLPPENWALDGDATSAQLERALLAIDVFPRCALLLSVFEKMSVEDTAVLLDGDLNLVRKGQIIGLQELTRNLAGVQVSRSTSPNLYITMSEMQHA